MCPFADFMRYTLRLEADAEAPAALRMGSAIHTSFEWLAKGASIDEALLKASEHYDIVPRFMSADELECEKMAVLCLVESYHQHYKDDGWQYIAVEHSFTQPIRNTYGDTHTEFHSHGVIDGIVKLPDGRTAIVEHKTTSMPIGPDSPYWSGLSQDAQLAVYLGVAREQFGEIDCVVYDVIHKPSYRQRSIPVLDENGLKVVRDMDGNRLFKKNGEPYLSVPKGVEGYIEKRPETPDEVTSRIFDEINDDPHDYFARKEIPITDDSIERMMHEVWDEADEVVWREENLAYPRARGPHCRNCEFNKACEEGYDPFGYENKPPVPSGYRPKKEEA